MPRRDLYKNTISFPLFLPLLEISSWLSIWGHSKGMFHFRPRFFCALSLITGKKTILILFHRYYIFATNVSRPWKIYKKLSSTFRRQMAMLWITCCLLLFVTMPLCFCANKSQPSQAKFQLSWHIYVKSPEKPKPNFSPHLLTRSQPVGFKFLPFSLSPATP